MTVTDRTAAPAPSPAEQAVIDQFGIFEAEERVVEEVARLRERVVEAMSWAETFDDGRIGQERAAELLDEYLAAVAAYRAQDGGVEEAVRRESASGIARAAWAEGYEACRRGQQKHNPYRAALAPQAGDGAR